MVSSLISAAHCSLMLQGEYPVLAPFLPPQEQLQLGWQKACCNAKAMRTAWFGLQ